MPINLGILASSMWMSLFFGLGTVVNIKKIREWPLIIKNSIIISQVLGAIFFLNIINENAITSRFFAVLGIVTCIVAVSLLDKCDCVEKCMLGIVLYTKKYIINFIGNKSLIGGTLPKIILFI